MVAFSSGMGKDLWRCRSPLQSFWSILIRHGKSAHTLTAVQQVEASSRYDPNVEGEENGEGNSSTDLASGASNSVAQYVDSSKWVVLDSRALGLRNSMITAPTWTVLNILREKGSNAYLVGGCVRDLLLEKTPKDFDIITSANPTKIIKSFSRCYLVGKRFPVCLVKIQDSIVEVASFETSEQLGDSKFRSFVQRPSSCSDGDYVRWKDCMRRDFTINGLIYDPFGNLVYDYLGGIRDIKRAKVRTVIPAHASFEEDCARILRAFRVAGRLGFEFVRDTACAIQDLSHSILELNKHRLMLEMNYMLAHGAAKASLCLLMRYGVLEILLPVQAAYLSSQGFERHREICNESNMLLALFSNLDRYLASNRPCHSSLWVGLLALHLALHNNPQDALVVTSFSLTLYYCGDAIKAMNAARKIVHMAKTFSPETFEAEGFISDELLLNQILKFASAARSSLSSMAYNKHPTEATSENSQKHVSDVVFLSKTLHAKVKEIFSLSEENALDVCKMRERLDIDYKLLSHGKLDEVRFALAKIVLDTLYVNIGDVLNGIDFKSS